ncbi:hypothetical protein [Hymenobacter terricola]|uniref:hypothetical protein n=1 Tax=Hymenobacter terricola TaxID=2819236 RepID=UPI001CF25AFA|nr:hypothetical protein [Hymenobacter terricola]
MTTISFWVGHLIAALVYAAIAHLAALGLHQALPPVSRGLYQAIRLRQAPDDWTVSFVRFATLFLLATVAGACWGWAGSLRGCCWAGLATTCFGPFPAPSRPRSPAAGTSR